MRISNYTILIVGVGGTGGLLANFLAKSLAGRNDIDIALIDADVVEEKNLKRQPYVVEDIGSSKATALAGALTDVYGLNVRAFSRYINSTKDISECLFEGRIVNSYECCNILCGCVDNHAARKVMHDYFMDNSGPLIYIDSGNEFSYGEVVFAMKNAKGDILSPDKLFYFPDLFDGDMTPRSEESCTDMNESAPQHLATNILAADVMLSGILGFIQEKRMPSGIVYFDSGIDGEFKMKRVPYVAPPKEEKKPVKGSARRGKT